MLIQNIQNSERYENEIEGEVYFPLFNKTIKVNSFKKEHLDYANQCAKLLAEIPDETVLHLCQSSAKYCNDVLSDVGEDVKHFSNEKDILSLVYPNVLIIPEKSDNMPLIHLELNCEWEEEHGMEWLIRDGKVEYVGSFNGNDPFGNYAVKEFWNFA